MSSKAEIRARMRKIGMTSAERASASARIAAKALSLPEYALARRVLLFAGKADEVDTSALIGEILRSGRELYLPLAREGEMSAMRLMDADDLRPGAFGVLEPPEGEKIEPAKLELVFAPGVAFDRLGHRLGRGGGYYDRFLPGCRCPVAGLAFEFCLADGLPTEPHDALMDYVITERRVYDCAYLRNTIDK